MHLVDNGRVNGTATTRDWAHEDRCSAVWNFAPSGDSSARAQKFTAKPIVATISITQGRDPVFGPERLATCVTPLLVSILLLIDASSVGTSWMVLTMCFGEKF